MRDERGDRDRLGDKFPSSQSPEEFLAACAQIAASHQRMLFEETGNAQHVIRAYQVYRHFGVPPADWILAYIDRSFAGARTASSAPGVAAAFGLHSAEGSPSAKSRAETMTRNLGICLHIDAFKKLKSKGLGITERRRGELPGEFVEAGRLFHLSALTVKSIYYDPFGKRGHRGGRLKKLRKLAE